MAAATVCAAAFVTVPFAATPASAAPVPVNMLCLTTAFGSTIDPGYDLVDVDISVPASVPEGDALTLSVSVNPTAGALPFAVTNLEARGNANIAAAQRGGGLSTSLTGLGPLNPPTAIAPYAPVPTGGPVGLTMSTAGYAIGDYIDLSLTNFQFEVVAADDGLAGMTVTCTPVNPSAVIASTYVGVNTNSIGNEQCVAQTAGQPGSCEVGQLLEAAVTPGSLTQRAFQTGTNPTSQIVDLGSIQTPVRPTAVYGDMNQITVTDARGGQLGWSLTATLSPFVGSNPAHKIPARQLSATPSCNLASAGTAWDYDASGMTTVGGYDPGTSAPGVTAGPGDQDFNGVVTLCTKDTTTNVDTGSTSGIYNVFADLKMIVPGFQAADNYTAVLTITLA